MARIQYSKLIRDRIPDILQAEGKRCETETLSEADYRQALLTKLVEEAEEASAASGDKLVTELADLYEVIEAVMAAHGIDGALVLRVQQERRDQRGGFEKRLKLLWVEDDDRY